jgi:hypothetical protein
MLDDISTIIETAVTYRVGNTPKFTRYTLHSNKHYHVVIEARLGTAQMLEATSIVNYENTSCDTFHHSSEYDWIIAMWEP